MKITKEQLNQMIQEELDSYLSEFEGNEEVTSEEDDMDAPMDDMEMADAGENEELMDSLRNLYDVLKGMFDAALNFVYFNFILYMHRAPR
jgi:hypothetical protein